MSKNADTYEFDLDEIKEALPFMVDLLNDTGGREENPAVWDDIKLARSLVKSGSGVCDAEKAKSLKEFLDLVI